VQKDQKGNPVINPNICPCEQKRMFRAARCSSNPGHTQLLGFLRNREFGGFESSFYLMQIQVKPVKHMKAAEKGEKGREQASSQERRLQRSSRVVADVVPETPPKHFQWKQFLGSKATVNSSTVATVRDEFEFDLGRFSKTDSVAKTTQSLVESEVQPETDGSFQVTKSLLLLRLDHQDNQSQEALHGASGSVIMCEKDSQRIVLTKRASEEPLWKRRHGQKPLTLTLRKESSSAPATLEGSK